MQVKHEAGVWIPLYIMTSEKNDVQTRTFFEEHDFFGYDSSYVKFFCAGDGSGGRFRWKHTDGIGGFSRDVSEWKRWMV